jgi:hypothetical protein
MSEYRGIERRTKPRGDDTLQTAEIFRLLERLEKRLDEVQKSHDDRISKLERHIYMALGGIGVVSTFVIWGLNHLTAALK